MEVTVNISRLPATQGTEASQTADWGRLVILDANGEFEAECPLVKRSTLIGRDDNLDVFVNKMEVSRRHLEVSVQEDNKVYVNSLGRQTVSVNGEPVPKGQPAELFSGDVIEIHLQDRIKCIRYEGNEDTIQLNRSMTIAPTTTALDALLEKTNINPTSLLSTGKKTLTGRKPGASAGRRKSSIKASAVAGKGLRKAAPPPPPPLPQGSLFSKGGEKAAASAPLAPPPPPSLISLHAAIKSAALKRGQEQAPASQPPNPSSDPAAGPKTAASSSAPLIPSLTDLQAARAGLRKTKRPQPAEVDATDAASHDESDIPNATAAGNSKRKSVRFALPRGAAPASPKEGLVSDATCQLPAPMPQPVEDHICIGADSTLAFSAWAMGSAANPTEFIPGLEVLVEGYEPTEEVPAEAVLQTAETSTVPEVTGELQSAAPQLGRTQDFVMTPAGDVARTADGPGEGGGRPGQEEIVGEPEEDFERRAGVETESTEDLSVGDGPSQADAPSLAELYQRHARAWKVARKYFTKNQILVSRMDIMGSKVWGLRKENRRLRAENQALRSTLDRVVTEAAYAEAGPQAAGTTPHLKLTRFARHARTPGSTKAVIRGRPIAGMLNEAEQPGAQERLADDSGDAEQSPEKQRKAMHKGSAEFGSGGKSAVGRSFLTPFTAPHRAQPGAGDSVVRDNVMGTIAAAKKMSQSSFGSAMQPSGRQQLQGRSPHAFPAMITPAATPTVSLLFGSGTRAASNTIGSLSLSGASGSEPLPSSAAGTEAAELAHLVDPVGSTPAGIVFDTEGKTGGASPEEEPMDEESLDQEVEDVTLELPAAGAGREDIEADSTVAFSEWAMGSQAVAALAAIQGVKLIKDQCVPPVTQAERAGPLLLEGPPQKSPASSARRAGRVAHKESDSAAKEANEAAAGEQKQSGDGELSKTPGSAGDAVTGKLRSPKPSSSGRGRMAASPKPMSAGGLGRCRRVTAPSREEAAAKQPVLGGPLEPILEEAEERSQEAEAEDEIPAMASPASLVKHSAEPAAKSAEASEEGEATDAEPAASREPEQSMEADQESEDKEEVIDLEAATPEDDACFACGSCEENDTLIICEKCERAAHPACVGLKRIPKGDWFCADCKPAKKAPAKGRKAAAKSDGPGSQAASQSEQRVSTRSSEPEAPQSKKRGGAHKGSQEEVSQPRAPKRSKASPPPSSSRQPSPPARSTRGKAAAQKTAEPEGRKISRLRR